MSTADVRGDESAGSTSEIDNSTTFVQGDSAEIGALSKSLLLVCEPRFPALPIDPPVYFVVTTLIAS
ncbi:hypothetical protein ACWEKT_24750 [Nocardia takedensis]|uniref:hypothetical protein n=1 Tax=Nocardia takedensis TaxID=259390 RepID=UPI0006883E4F